VFLWCLLAAGGAWAMDKDPSGFGAASWWSRIGGYKWLVATGCQVGPSTLADQEAGAEFFPLADRKDVSCYRLRGKRQFIAGQPLEKTVYLAWDGRFFAARGAFTPSADLAAIQRAFISRFGQPDPPPADSGDTTPAFAGAMTWTGRDVQIGLREHPAGYPEFFMFYKPVLKAIKSKSR